MDRKTANRYRVEAREAMQIANYLTEQALGTNDHDAWVRACEAAGIAAEFEQATYALAADHGIELEE